MSARAPARLGLGIAAALVAGCAAAPSALRPVALANPGFEDPSRQAGCAPGWGCSMHADPNSFRFFLDGNGAAAGAWSLCIEPVGREPWGKATQAVLDPSIRGRRVRFSAALRTADVAGHGAGVQAVAHGNAGEIMGVRDEWIAGTRPWQRLSLEIDVPPNTRDLEVGVALEGTGRACLDDARLEIVR
jgi:hypothetical protein